MAIKNEVDPSFITRADEEYGGGMLLPQEYEGQNIPNRKHRLAGGKANKLVLAQMKARMAALYRDGDSYKDICERVNDEYKLTNTKHELTVKKLSYHVQSMLQYWRSKATSHIDEKMALILLRYDQLETIATEAYYLSMKGKRTDNYSKQVNRIKGRPSEEELQQVIGERKTQRADQKGRRGFVTDPKLLIDEPEHDFGELIQETAEKITEYSRIEHVEAGDPRWVAILVDINHKRAQVMQVLRPKEDVSMDGESARLSDEARQQRISALLHQVRARREGVTATHLAPAAPLGGFLEGQEPSPEEMNAPLMIVEEEPKPQPKLRELEPELTWDLDEEEEEWDV